MNDMNHQQHESIRDGISSAADSIDVGDAGAALAAVHGLATARRRRRSAVLGVAAAGTLALTGAVLVNLVSRDGSNDVLMSADSVPATTDAPEAVEVAPPSTVRVAPASVPGATGEPIPVQVVAATSTVTSDPAFEPDASFDDVPQVFAWHDGFLAVRRTVAPQPLPAELPPEIVEQFPQEVLDLFPDGLPPTIDEAMDRLDAAGLLDEVTAIVTANSDVLDAIYSVPSEVTVSVRFSTDGVDWSDADASFPDELSTSYGLYSTGDRFVIVSDGRSFGIQGSPTADDPTADDPNITVLSSTDLVNWSRQTIPVPPAPTDTPEYLRVDTFPEELVANADRWVLKVSTYSDVDVISLLDEELRDRVENESGGYGTSTDDEGITVEIYDPIPVDDGETPDSLGDANGPSERIRYTWSELGLDGPVDELNQSTTVTWTSNWVDEPVRSADAAAGEPGWHRTAAVDSGFVTAAENSVLFSADGLEWANVDLPVEGFVNGLIPLDDAVVAFVNGSDGTVSQYHLDIASMAWTTIAIDGLPDFFSLDRSVNGAALLYEHSADRFDGPPSTSVGSAEVDGYRVELTTTFSQNAGQSTYTVTDIASGEVVSTETTPDFMSDESPFEFAEESYDIGDREGIIFLDPETGERLVSVPFESMTFVQLDADGQPIDMRDFSEPEPSIPSRWLLATDGTSWVVEQVSEETSVDTEEAAMAAEIGDLAFNDGTVLLARFDGTFVRYDIG